MGGCLWAAVVNGEREHAAQTVDALRAPFLVRVEDDFRIGAGAEAVAAARQFRPQVQEVVDLAVEHDGQGAVLVEHGLVAAGEVDDGQAAHAQVEVKG